MIVFDLNSSIVSVNFPYAFFYDLIFKIFEFHSRKRGRVLKMMLYFSWNVVLSGILVSSECGVKSWVRFLCQRRNYEYFEFLAMYFGNPRENFV